MEQIPDTFPDLFWGYSIIWGLLVVYIISLGRRLSRIENTSSDRK